MNPAATAAPNPARLALVLGALVAIGPLAIDTYLPALPAMATDYGVGIHAVEISVSLYMLGVALGQWLGGPLSDQLGRKPVAYCGLLLFFFASLAIPFSTEIHQLYVLRLLQAVGGGAIVVVAGASVRDHYIGRQAAQVLTTVGLVMLLAPLLAPALGALILNTLGWFSIFFFLAIYAFLLVPVVRFGLPAVHKQRAAMPLWQSLFQGYGRVLRQRQAMGFILANGLAFAAMFTFITDSAFLYISYFQVPPSLFPVYFGANVVTMLALNRLNVRLLRYHPPARIMAAGLLVQASASAILLGLTMAGLLSLWTVVPLIMLVTGTVALIVPNAIACFLDFFPHDSGAATGLNGALQFLLAGLIGTAVAALHGGTPLSMVQMMTASSLAALLCFSLLARDAKEGDQAHG